MLIGLFLGGVVMELGSFSRPNISWYGPRRPIEIYWSEKYVLILSANGSKFHVHF